MSLLRAPLLLVTLAGLAACTPTVPDSGAGAGVGFTDYNTYLRQREAALRSGAPAPTPPGGPIAGVSTPLPTATPASGFSTDRIGATLDAAAGVTPAPVTGAPLSGTTAFDPTLGGAEADRPRGITPAGIREESGEVAGVVGGTGAISDEQDFQAVSQRETIESDAERIARNRSQYVQIQPTDLPQRPSDTGPNIVAFALSTTHGVGQPQYRRSGIGGNPERACSKYPSADLAQQAFLERGGPERDRLGVDPDGDGFACSWDPRPFRAAQN
ncbi:MAG: hypothetical protein ACRC6I_05045 [Paracoccaceae bacterium]